MSSSTPRTSAEATGVVSNIEQEENTNDLANDVLSGIEAKLQSMRVHSDQSAEVKSANGMFVTVSGVQLPVRTDQTPDDLKHIPKSTVYLDNKGVLGDIALLINANVPVLIEGETGVGKTSAFRYLAHLTQSPYRRLNLNGSTTVDEFVGKVMLNKEGTYWQDGVLIEAMRRGYWLVLDEINAALPEILFVLHSLLDDDGFVVLSEKDGEVVRPHANFRVFATMNPSEGGYSGTKSLNQAFLDRFVKLQFEFPTLAQERKMVEKRYPKMGFVTTDKLTQMIKYAGEMRTAYSQGAQEFLISPRGVLQWAHLAEMFGDIQKGAEYALISKAPAEERNAIRDVLKLRFGLGIGDYVNQCQLHQLYGIGDEVVVHVTPEDMSSLTNDFTALYEVLEVNMPPVREEGGEVAIDRVTYKLKNKGATHKEDLLNTANSYVKLGTLKTAKYHGIMSAEIAE